MNTKNKSNTVCKVKHAFMRYPYNQLLIAAAINAVSFCNMLFGHAQMWSYCLDYNVIGKHKIYVISVDGKARVYTWGR